MSYIVVIVVDNKWYSDHKMFKSLSEARNAKREIAKRNWSFDTAIAKGGEIMFFEDSAYELAHFENDTRER